MYAELWWIINHRSWDKKLNDNKLGDSDPVALEGLSKMFFNPEAYNILPYKHNFTEDNNYALTAFFMPAFAMLIDPQFMDNRGYTDMVKARAYFESERKKKSGQVLLDYCAEYCFTPQNRDPMTLTK